MTTRYQANPNVIARSIRGEDVLVPLASTMEGLDSIYALNETASLVRRLAAEGQDAAAIARQLQEAFDVDAETAARDVQAVMAELMRIGALQAAQ